MDGFAKVNAGTDQLTAGTQDFGKGMDSLTAGSAQLKDGSAALAGGADALSAGAAQISDSTAALSAGLSGLKRRNRETARMMARIGIRIFRRSKGVKAGAISRYSPHSKQHTHRHPRRSSA